MANEQNLIPFNELTESERREMARKAGIASGEARRKKRDMKEAINLLLANPAQLKGESGEYFKKRAEELGIQTEDLDNQMLLVISTFLTAISGGKNSVSAATFIRDTIGEKPVEHIEMNASVNEKAKEIEDYVNRKRQVSGSDN